jgi:hypothetical protein
LADHVRFHRPVILVNDVVELFALLDAEYAFAFQRPHRGWIGLVLINIDDLRYWITRGAKYLPKEPLRRSPHRVWP